jgi:hypothetical protein
MATDGPKIIDGDIAFDTYWGIIDLYDNDADIETIKNEIPFVRYEYGVDNDFHHEVYVTSYALAFWEIGAMNDEILNEVHSVIEKGACVKEWAKDDPKAAKTRQKELERLWKKISYPNANTRKKKKYKKVAKLLFEENDLLCFRLPNKYYYVTSVLEVEQYRGSCTYRFCITTYKSLKKPTIEDVEKEFVYGRYDQMHDGTGVEIIKDLADFIKKHTTSPKKFFISLQKMDVEHKLLKTFADLFEKIGELTIKPYYKEHTCVGGLSETLDVFYETFERQDAKSNFFKLNKIPIWYLVADSKASANNSFMQ